ncbi:MAG: sll0787 family AIR synthase-like protein [Chthoniobacteraceae bacterium]
MPEATDLSVLIERLRSHPNVQAKLQIASAYSPALGVSGPALLGDDTAAIPDGDGYLLFAAEGMIEAFIEFDPWFAGYSAVMVNLSDIAAMGGSPIALTDVLWTADDSPVAQELWAGMQAASKAYGVPIVGGHTTRYPVERTPLLAVSVLGRAKQLITSFGARPGDRLLMVIDLEAAYRGENTLFWNASTTSTPEKLRAGLALFPALAEAGLVTAGKDISNGGLPGTLGMLLATSRCGAHVNLDALPRPGEATLDRWLLSFPSYGYLLTARPENAPQVIEHFRAHNLTCAGIGEIIEPLEMTFTLGPETARFCEIAAAPSIQKA